MVICFYCGENIESNTHNELCLDWKKKIKENKMEIRKEIQGFAEAMERVMRQHDGDKGETWKDLSFETLQILMLKEVEETKLLDAKLGEWVDVANLCMMIYHNALHKKNPQGGPYRICYDDNKTNIRR